MTGIQKYLDSALTVLERYGITEGEGDESRIAGLLQGVVSVDEPKVLAIARTLQYAGTFNELVRENVEDVKIAERYNGITSMFDSIRDDSKRLVKQLEDGKVDLGEKVSNLWMRLARGTPHKRFEKIKETYLDVSKDTSEHIDSEEEIMKAYINFRFALKEAESLAYDVLKTQDGKLTEKREEFLKAADKVKGFVGETSEKSKLELERDALELAVKEEDKKYQLIKDIAENLTVGYNVGETLVAKLQQTHNIKEQVYKRSAIFFATNEHVFTILDAVYTSQHGLHEATQTLEAMKSGANKGIEDVAELGGKLEQAALEAGYGSTIDKDSVKKLVDAIVTYQEQSVLAINRLRKESTDNAKEIEKIVEDGKQRYRLAEQRFLEGKA